MSISFAVQGHPSGLEDWLALARRAEDLGLGSDEDRCRILNEMAVWRRFWEVEDEGSAPLDSDGGVRLSISN